MQLCQPLCYRFTAKILIIYRADNWIHLFCEKWGCAACRIKVKQLEELWEDKMAQSMRLGWEGCPATKHTAGWPGRSSYGASAPSSPFTQNLMAWCVVRCPASFSEGAKKPKSYYWLWRTSYLNYFESLWLFRCLVSLEVVTQASS